MKHPPAYVIAFVSVSLSHKDIAKIEVLEIGDKERDLFMRRDKTGWNCQLCLSSK